MITKHDYDVAVNYCLKKFSEAGIRLTDKEKQSIEVADFGLGDLKHIGLQILTYVNTERVCAKEMVLMPYQTCPEHLHPDLGNSPGKEETFRCRRGKVYLYINGEKSDNIKAKLPPTKVTVFKEIELNEGEQYTLYPKTLHWFQAGAEGAVISEFSTKSCDENDIFTDKRIRRLPELEK